MVWFSFHLAMVLLLFQKAYRDLISPVNPLYVKMCVFFFVCELNGRADHAHTLWDNFFFRSVFQRKEKKNTKHNAHKFTASNNRNCRQFKRKIALKKTHVQRDHNWDSVKYTIFVEGETKEMYIAQHKRHEKNTTRSCFCKIVFIKQTAFLFYYNQAIVRRFVFI